MRYIEFEDEHRRRHFEFFNAMEQPHVGVTAEVEISKLLEVVRESADWRFTNCVVYLLSRVAHSLPVFRQRIRRGQVVEHERLDPSFAVPTRDSSVFSFCTVRYDSDAAVFHERAVAVTERMWTNPSFKDEPGRDNYLFMSAMPWIRFTHIRHAMPSPPDSVPRLSWGKYHKQGDEVTMPLAVQAHHALVDGRDLGDFYREMQLLLDRADEIFVKS